MDRLVLEESKSPLGRVKASKTSAWTFAGVRRNDRRCVGPADQRRSAFWEPMKKNINHHLATERVLGVFTVVKM